MLYGLGKNVNGVKNAMEAIDMAELDWTVSPKRISVEGIEVPNYIANVKSDGKVLGIVSEQYKIVQNEEAFGFADNLVGKIEYKTAGSLYNDKKVWLSGKFHDIVILGETLESHIVFSNCHDGKGSIRVSIIPIMKSINAPMNIPLDANRSWSTTHSGDFNKKIEQAKETLNFAEEYLAALMREAKQMAETKVTEKQKIAFIERLFPINPDDKDRKIDNINEARNDLKNTINSITSYEGTAWQLITGVCSYVANAQPKRSSDTFFERKFDSIITGDWLIDKAYKLLKIKRAKEN